MIRVRFAPSPTGHLHIGNLRAALFNWLFARHHGGEFLLRIEDTDLERSKEFYVDSILASLSWCALNADQPPVIQSSRVDEHRKVAKQLLAAGKAYKCFCSQEDVALRLGASVEQDIGSIGYDGYCFDQQDSNQEDDQRSYVIRFRAPVQGELSYEDAVHGLITFNMGDIDDFVIIRSDGSPTYNFVVVIDDAFMQITHVIRGDDHISNTPKQILLYQALDLAVPVFAHVPLIVGPGGQRLSKRDAATSVLDYQKQGFLADGLCNYLVRLGWSHGDQEIFTRLELIQQFDLDGINKSGAAFDLQKLLWVNSVFIKQATPEDLLTYITSDVDSDFKSFLADWSISAVLKAIALYQSRVQTLKELIDEIKTLYAGAHASKADASLFSPESVALIADLTPVLAAIDPLSWTSDHIGAIIKEFCSDHEIKLPDIAKPLRLVLVGKPATPGIFDLLELIGYQATLVRLNNFLQ